MKKLVPLFCAWLLVGIHMGCFDTITEAPFTISDEEIPAPEGLAARVEDGKVTLSWHAVADATGYRVYRSIDVAARPERLVGITDTAYADSDVQNGRSYFYSVASVGANALEGKRSSEILAVPSIYSIVINGGEAYSSSAAITLALTAPETTAHMMIAHDASLAGGTWETFAPSRVWRIDGQDGNKKVYARFRDASGALSPVVCDSITLDTYAMITLIEISPAPRVYSPASTVHFSLSVEESETLGRARLSFENYTVLVDLYDDGRGGDETAGDGVYEADYRFPESIRGLDITVTGAFTDRAGNEAPVFECRDKISFSDPPAAIELIGVADSSTTSITIKWVASQDENFLSYRIYRSTTAGVAESAAHFVRELANPAQTSYPDGALKEGMRYYYRIFVVNDLDERAGSNEISAHTFDAVPNPVVLDDPSSVGGDKATLTWSSNGSTDFKEYRLYRSMVPGVTMSATLVATISDREKTYHDDSGLDLINNRYYYRVYVMDLGGKYSRSNEVATVLQ